MYAGCKYNCDRNNMVYDRARGKKVPCPHCSKIAENHYNAPNSPETKLEFDELGITDPIYTWSKVVSVQTLRRLEPESIDEVENEVNQILDVVRTSNEGFKESICVGITEKGKPEHIAMPILAFGLKAGKTVGKLITASEYNIALIKNNLDTLEAMWKSTVVPIIIDYGTTKESIMAVKGLMEIRALKGLSTILITTWRMEALSSLLSWKDDPTLSQARAVFLQYKTTGNAKPMSGYMRGITGFTEGSDTSEDAQNDNSSLSFNDL